MVRFHKGAYKGAWHWHSQDRGVTLVGYMGCASKAGCHRPVRGDFAHPRVSPAVATDPGFEVLARHDAGHEHQALDVEDLVQQPVVEQRPSGGQPISFGGAPLLDNRSSSLQLLPA